MKHKTPKLQQEPNSGQAAPVLTVALLFVSVLFTVVFTFYSATLPVS